MEDKPAREFRTLEIPRVLNNTVVSSLGFLIASHILELKKLAAGMINNTDKQTNKPQQK